MTRHLTTALAIATFAACAAAHGATSGALRIGEAWIRPPPPGAPTAAAYLTLTNSGAAPDRLLGGSTAAAASLELHQTSMAGGVMRMRDLPDGVPIGPGQTVRFSPGGYHLMLSGLRRPLRAGDRIPVTLRFAHAGALNVDFDVQAQPSSAGNSAPAMTMR